MTADSGTVMVVEDMPEVLDMLSDILSDSGYRVIAADGGQQALEAVGTGQPDLILLDIHMPEMNGFDVFRRLKSRPDAAHIPVVFLTGSVEMDDRLEGLRMGAVDYICKPCQREELLARVKTHLELARMRLRLEEQNTSLKQANAELQAALLNVKALRGLIPICASCKKIRDDAGYWQAVEQYIGEHSEAKFSHGMCPECTIKMFPEFGEIGKDAI